MIVLYDNVTKKYSDDCGVFDISFAIEKKDIVGLLGRNGAGKTTIIKLMMNLIHQDSGNIRIFSKAYCKNEKNIKEKIGFVYDDFMIYPTYNVKKINSMMKIFYKTWNEEKFFNIVKELDIPTKKQFRYFSKGNKMKVNIAMALSHSARLLVLDEPTSGLDAYARNLILNKLEKLNKEEDVTIIFSSHITSDIENIASDIIFLTLFIINVIALIIGYVAKQNLSEIILFIAPLFITMSTIMSNLFGDLILKNDSFICSFPISRKEFIASKYIFPVFILGIELINCIMIAGVSNLVGIVSIQIDGEYILRLIITLLVLISFMLPIFLSIQSTKLISWITLIIYAVIILSSKILSLVNDMLIKIFGVDVSVAILNKFSEGVPLFIVICFYLISFVFSCKKYSQKDI